MDDLKLIKKHYGEKMMHYCRKVFPTILETEGLLYTIISSNFYPSRFLYDDLIEQNIMEDFKNFILSFIKKEKVERVFTDKNPFELMREAGYTLYECKSQEDLERFKKYYRVDEKLCTFSDDRLDSHFVFFAVKDNAENIKRGLVPKRQDEYGTSVISIQFSKSEANVLSIKNRYNHTVKNPDATFSNNLENIIPGLTYSFGKYYNFDIIQNEKSFELEDYVNAVDGRYYKYNYEINNIYYCPDNIIIADDFIINYKNESERYIIFDYYMLDLKEKRIYLYDKDIEDCFVDDFVDIEKINITKNIDNENKIIEIKLKYSKELIVIELDKYNRMIKYKNNVIKKIRDFYLNGNKYLEEVEFFNAEFIGNMVLYYNKFLKKFIAPNVIKIGYCFMYENKALIEADFTNLVKVDHLFLCSNNSLKTLKCHKLREVANCFLLNNKVFEYGEFPNLTEIGSSFFGSNLKFRLKFYSDRLKSRINKKRR